MDLRVTHDYEAESVNVMYLSGLKVDNDSKLRNVLNKIYFYFIMAFMLMVMVMSATSAAVVPNMVKSMEGIHWTLLLFGVGCFIYIKRSTLLKDHLLIIQAGFFRYQQEPPDDRQYKRKQYHVWRVRLVSKVFFILVVSVGICTSFARVFNSSSYGGTEANIKNINPLYPIPLYMPFDTNTTAGFLFGFFIEEVTILYLSLSAIGTQQVFFSIIEQWLAQFEILNISIANVQERAFAIYNHEKKFNDSPSVDELFYSKEFQRCVSRCLRQNVMHHHILLRFRKAVGSYFETLYLVLYLIPVAGLGAMVLAILDMEDYSEVPILLWLLGNEILYIYMFSFYGDLLRIESGKLFFSLWDTPWWNFDKSNRTILLIMMTNVMKPTIISAPGLNTDMSSESFGDMISSAYQFMNVIRNFK